MLTSKRSLLFALVFVVVNLHVLRNLLGVVYLGAYALVFLLVGWEFVRTRAFQRVDLRIVYLFGAVFLVGFISTWAVSGLSSAAYGLSRLVFATPIFLALATYTEDARDLRRHISTMVGFFTVAVLTLPLQFLIGPIGWFAPDSVRAGIDRYASLLGSLTVIGVVAASYLILGATLPFKRALPLWVAQLVTMLVSLSKAAVGNAVIALGVILWLWRARFKRLALSFGLVLTLTGVVVAAWAPARVRLQASLESFGIGSGSGTENYDSNVLVGAWDRLTTLPLENVSALVDLDNWVLFITGGGFGLAGMALVPADAVLGMMAHNQYVELLTVFGVAGGVPLIAALVLAAVKLLRLARETESTTVSAVLWAYLAWMGNALFANGPLYQPAAASILYLALFVAFTKVDLREPDGELAISEA